ncbi:MAG: helix-turn-helix transcriptional regulator [Thermodesulfovibrionales bacterium]
MFKEKTGIGDRIRQVRLKKNLSQESFAKLVESSKSSISGYELGDVPVPADVLRNIVMKCDVSADWLLLGLEPDIPKNEKERLLLNKYREAEIYGEEEDLLRYATWRVSEGKIKYGQNKIVESRESKITRDKAG